MLAGGVAATAALVLWAGYPASMVGVNGAAISNLNPPTLAVVTFGIAQAGLVLLLREPLARLMRRPLAWAAVATANLSAMTLFLWHQTAFLAVTMAALLIGRLPGLHTAPDSAMWIAERTAWLPVFAVALAVLWLVFRRAERAPVRRRRRPVASSLPAQVGGQLTVAVARNGRALPSRIGKARPPGTRGRYPASPAPDRAVAATGGHRGSGNGMAVSAC